MARDRIQAGTCAQCSSGTIVCTYNVFTNPQKRIDSWEHRCDNCGFRVTEAFRSDEPKTPPVADPEVCPFCARRPGGAAL